MTEYIVRRTLWIIPVLLLVALVTFVLMHRAPGGPWDNDKPIPESTKAILDRKFGLDKPLWFNPVAFQQATATGANPLVAARALFDSQFFNYLFDAVRGDLGPTYTSKGTENVQDVLRQKFPASAKVGVIAVFFAMLVGIPLGVVGALRQNTWVDYLSLFLSTIGVSVPSFIVAVLTIIFLSSWFGVPPVRRPEEWVGFGPAYLLPGIMLGLGTMSFLTRLTRTSVLEVKRQDFIRTARSKGLADHFVVMRHMLRNSMIPVITVLGPAVADLVTGGFIIESVFNVPGMGREFVSSITGRDYSMIMGTTLFYALLVALANLSVDLSYGLLDPRIRMRR